MRRYQKPLPTITAENAPYWEGCRRGELWIQRCADCGRLRHYPRPMCPYCQSLRRDWAQVSGRGHIHSYTIVHQASHPAFIEDVPYNVVLVSLDEAEEIRLVGNLVDCAPEEIKIGKAVEVVFDDISREITLPRWRLVPADK